MNNRHEHGHRFQGTPDRLRSPERIELLQVDRVLALCIDDLTITNVLDVGTGSGVFAKAFAGIGAQVTGIDPNPEMLEIVRRYVPSGTFQDGISEKLPFHDAAFDLVFLSHVLHETDDPLAALSEAGRVARQRVVVLEWPYREEEHGPPLAHRLEPQTIVDLAHEAGFRGIECHRLKHMDIYLMSR